MTKYEPRIGRVVREMIARARIEAGNDHRRAMQHPQDVFRVPAHKIRWGRWKTMFFFSRNLFFSDYVFMLIISTALFMSSAHAQPYKPKFVAVAPESFSNSFVRCFYKDSQGYMWMGTTDGLVRYDGTNSFFYEHNPKDKNTIPHMNINAIMEDSLHRLWVGTSQGLCVYDRAKDHFINYELIAGEGNQLNNYYVTSLALGANGQIWIGTLGGGVNVYDPINNCFSYLNKSSDDKKNYITSILSVDDLMWCGTKGGLQIYLTLENTSVSSTLIEGPSLESQVTQLVADKVGNIWLSTINGEIMKLTPGNGYYSLKNVFSGTAVYGASWNSILTMCFDKKGNLWIAGEKSGLNYLDTKTNEVSRFLAEDSYPDRIPTNYIRCVYVDREGMTWIGTHTKGAYLVDDDSKKFENYAYEVYQQSDFYGTDVKGFAEDQSGNVWIVSEGHGLGKLDSKTNTLQNCDQLNRLISNKFLSAIVCDRWGKLWIGTVGDGVYKIDVDENSLTKYDLKSDGFGDNKTSSLYEDKKGVIWVGSSGSGLFYFDESKQKFVNLCEEEKPNFIPKTSYVSSFAEDADGIFWVGTMYGLYKLQRESKWSFQYQWFSHGLEPGKLSSSSIQTLYEDKRKNLWVGTTDNGMNVKRKGASGFEVIQKEHGLGSNTVRAMLEDASGHLWISGNRGLSKLDPTLWKFTNFSREDGLASNNFNNNACLRRSTGELFFGSNNGFNAFYPDSIREHSSIPKLYLTDLRINNQSVKIGAPGSPLEKHISLTSAIELSYEQRSFIIDFVAIEFGQSSRYEYCYKLAGFELDWNCIGSNHSAIYTNLDPGNYVFSVKVSDLNGVWSEIPVDLKVVIRPLPWKSWWAMSLYAFALGIATFTLVKVRMERVKMKNQLTLERMEREREHELSELKTQFFTNISHEFRTPLSLISMPLENLTSGHDLPASVKDRLKTIQTNSDKMLRLVNELMDFNKLESAQLKLRVQQGELVSFITEIATVFIDLAEKRDIRFGIHPNTATLEGWFDHDKLEKIVVNVLSNAFKFTAAHGEINIFIHSFTFGPESALSGQRGLELIIVDDGIGIPKEELPYIFNKFYQAQTTSHFSNQGTGIGLALTKGLVELHRGKIEAQSSPSREAGSTTDEVAEAHTTKFLIQLPIDREAFEESDICERSGYVVSPPFMTNFDAEDAGEIDALVEEEDTSKPKILIVEDNEELRKYLAMELSPDFHIIESSDGKQGFDMACEEFPDLIISDVMMPFTSGIELCEQLKSNLQTSHIPIILLSAKATIEDQIRGVKTGADLYITKPFSIRFLVAHVRQIIDSRQKLYYRLSQDVYLLPSKITSSEIDQEFLQKAIDYITDNILDPQLNVDAIAALFSLSRMQVYRKIKALTGKSVVDLIRTVRIRQALKLMETHKYTLSEVAYQTGFNSASYFSKCFKEQLGKAPSEYLEARR